MVVRLGGQRGVVNPLVLLQRRRASGLGWRERRYRLAADRGAVVTEGDQRVARVAPPGFLDDRHEAARLDLAVDDHAAGEEAVPAVLGVALGELEQLDVGRVAAQLL